MKRFCAEFGVAHEECGKLVVATTEAEVPRLAELIRRGTSNGLAGIRVLSSAEAREREPHVRCVQAVLVPEEGIVDYPAVCAALVDRITELGGEVRTSCEVRSITATNGGWIIQAGADELRSSFLINCAGLYCDRVAEMCGETLDLRIVPFRGEYYQLREDRQSTGSAPDLPGARSRLPIPRRALHADDSRRNRSRAKCRAGVRARRLSGGNRECARRDRRADFSRTVAIPSAISFDGELRAAPIVESSLVLQVVAAARS